MSQGEMDSRGLVGLVAAADESWAASESPVSVCTGTKIADGFILTARHCVHTREGDLRHVSFATDLFTPAAVMSMRPVLDVTINDESDLAVVRYGGPRSPAAHRSASLVSSLDELAACSLLKDGATPVTVFGFGAQGDGPWSEREMGKLRTTQQRVISPSYSVREPLLTTRPLSAFEGVCFGDSGGPAFLPSGAQLGVLSQIAAGSGWCGGSLETYVNLAAQRAWIDDAVRSLGGGSRRHGGEREARGFG